MTRQRWPKVLRRPMIVGMPPVPMTTEFFEDGRSSTDLDTCLPGADHGSFGEKRSLTELRRSQHYGRPGDVKRTGLPIRDRRARSNAHRPVLNRGSIVAMLGMPSPPPVGRMNSDTSGAGVNSVAVGNEVIGYTNNRASHAEYVLVEAANLTRS